MTKISHYAIVIGAGISGLLAARGFGPHAKRSNSARSGISMRSVSLIVFALLTAAPTLAAAEQSCTSRRAACDNYCTRGRACQISCQTAHENCMATGCWENVGVPKQCGFARR